MLRHPVNAPQWKTIDRLYPKFSKEARNLCLGLSTDGINPYGLQSSSHRTEPVLLVNQNHPHNYCQFLFMEFTKRDAQHDYMVVLLLQLHM